MGKNNAKQLDLNVELSHPDNSDLAELKFHRDFSSPHGYGSRISVVVYSFFIKETPTPLIINMTQNYIFNGKNNGHPGREAIHDCYYFKARYQPGSYGSEIQLLSHEFEKYHGPKLIGSGIDREVSRLREHKDLFAEAFEVVKKKLEGDGSDLAKVEARISCFPMMYKFGEILGMLNNNQSNDVLPSA